MMAGKMAMEHTRKQGEVARDEHVEVSNNRASRKMVHVAHMPEGELACEGKCGGFQQQGLRDDQVHWTLEVLRQY